MTDRRLARRPGAARVEDGSASILIVLLFAALLGFVALISDGRYLIAQRHQTRTVAAQAARAAVQEIDTGRFAISHTIDLRPGPARTAADRIVATELPGASASVSITADGVTVTVHRTVNLPMLALLGVPSRTVEATASAHATAGVDASE